MMLFIFILGRVNFWRPIVPHRKWTSKKRTRKRRTTEAHSGVRQCARLLHRHHSTAGLVVSMVHGSFTVTMLSRRNVASSGQVSRGTIYQKVWPLFSDFFFVQVLDYFRVESSLALLPEHHATNFMNPKTDLVDSRPSPTVYLQQKLVHFFQKFTTLTQPTLSPCTYLILTTQDITTATVTWNHLGNASLLSTRFRPFKVLHRKRRQNMARASQKRLKKILKLIPSNWTVEIWLFRQIFLGIVQNSGNCSDARSCWYSFQHWCFKFVDFSFSITTKG